MPQTFTKDPDAILDYTVDWTDWLNDGTPDTIIASTWTAEAGITIDSDSNTLTTATVILSGGTLGEVYTVTNRIVTDQGLQDERSIFIRMRNK